MLHEEEQALIAVRAAVGDAVAYFITGAAPPDGRQPLTPDQATELLEVFGALLATQSPETTAFVAAHALQSELPAIFGRAVAEPLLFAPSVQGHPGAAGIAAQQQALARFKATAAQSVAKLVVAASESGEAVEALCRRAFTDGGLLSALLSAAANTAMPEAVRVAAVEALFAFVVRVHGGGEAFAAAGGVSAVASALVLDPSALVRSALSSVLREVAAALPAAVAAEPNALAVCLRLVRADESADVRVLVAETLEALLPHAPEAQQLLAEPRELLAALQDRLEREAAPEALDAACRLLETACVVAATTGASAFFDVLAQTSVLRLLAAGVKAPPLRPAAARARALRFVVQFAPFRLCLGNRLLSDFACLSVLLKSIIDAGSRPPPPADSDDALALQVLCVELALCLALVLAQSPSHREQLRRELHGFPMWAATLKANVAAFLNAAALEYFDAVDIVDATGVHINAMRGVEWSDATDKPRKGSVKLIFSAQEERVAAGTVVGRAPGLPPPPASAEEAHRKTRLTFVLLNYAAHLALAPSAGDDDAAPQPAPADSYGGAAEFTAQSFSHGAAVATPAPRTPRAASASAAAHSPALTSSRQPSRGPTFPRVSAARTSAAGASVLLSRTALTPAEREQMAIAYDKFDSALKLTLQFAEHYSRRRRDDAQFQPTPDGLVVRAAKLRNPWAGVVQHDSLKSWAVRDLREGDLFYFAIPFDELRAAAVEAVIERARRHVTTIKKLLVTAPQAARGRRWFLHDMLNAVMPRTLDVLSALRDLAADHGDDTVRFPVFLFREREMHVGERAVHPGNVVEVVDQVRFYFAQSPAELVGVDSASMQRLQARIADLQRREFTGDEALSAVGSDDAADSVVGAGAYGHGAISSESDGEEI